MVPWNALIQFVQLFSDIYVEGLSKNSPELVLCSLITTEINLQEQSFQIPDVSMLLMSSRKPSSATWASVNRKTIFLFSIPSLRYRVFRSSRKLISEYPLLNTISNTYKQRAKDYHHTSSVKIYIKCKMKYYIYEYYAVRNITCIPHNLQ